VSESEHLEQVAEAIHQASFPNVEDARPWRLEFPATQARYRQMAAAAIGADSQLLLRFVGSLTLADHLGDVADDVVRVLKELGREDIIERANEYDRDDWWRNLASALGDVGVTTLYATSLVDEESDDEED
jgi:hypothetical protein